MYRVEVFDMYAKASKGVFFVDDSVQLEYDYISPKVFSLKAPKDFDADLRNTLEIYHDSSPMARVNTCYVKDVERTDDATILTVAPLIMLLNEKSVQNVQSNTWGLQLWWQIHYDFIQATPSLYSVPWHYWSALPYTNWAGVQKPYGATLLNDMDCIIEARKTVGKYMTFAIGTLSSNLGHPYFGFLTGGSTPKVIEADLDNIIDKKISETTQGGYNIAMLWYPSAEGSTHYIHSDAVLAHQDDLPLIVQGDHGGCAGMAGHLTQGGFAIGQRHLPMLQTDDLAGENDFLGEKLLGQLVTHDRTPPFSSLVMPSCSTEGWANPAG